MRDLERAGWYQWQDEEKYCKNTWEGQKGGKAAGRVMPRGGRGEGGSLTASHCSRV